MRNVCGPRFPTSSNANAWWQQIDGSRRLRWERVESDRFERARQLFVQYRDKDLSFTDCTSFAVMRDLRVTTVITTDNHFHQVGFDVLRQFGVRPLESRAAPDRAAVVDPAMPLLGSEDWASPAYGIRQPDQLEAACDSRL